MAKNKDAIDAFLDSLNTQETGQQSGDAVDQFLSKLDSQDEPQKPEQSLLNVPRNAAKRLHLLMQASGMGSGLMPVRNPEAEKELADLQNINWTEVANKAIGRFSSASAQLSSFIKEAGLDKNNPNNDPYVAIGKGTALFTAKVGEILKDKLTHPIESLQQGGQALVGLPAAAVGMPIAAIEGVTGQDLRTAEPRKLTPEEQASKLYETAGNVAMLAITHATLPGAERIAAGIEGSARPAYGALADVVGGKAKAELNDGILKSVATNAPKRGRLMTKVLANTIAGTAGATSQAAVANLGNEDYLDSVVMSTVLGAPLGFAVELGTTLVKGAKPGVHDLHSLANDLWTERNLKFAADDRAADLVGKVEAFKSADNLFEALYNSKLEHIHDGPNKDFEPFIIRGVKRKDNILPGTDKDKIYAFDWHDNGNGTHDVMVSSSNSPAFHPDDLKFFKVTGFLQKSKVHIDGKEYTILGGNLGNLKELRLVDNDGNHVVAKPDQLTAPDATPTVSLYEDNVAGTQVVDEFGHVKTVGHGTIYTFDRPTEDAMNRGGQLHMPGFYTTEAFDGEAINNPNGYAFGTTSGFNEATLIHRDKTIKNYQANIDATLNSPPYTETKALLSLTDQQLLELVQEHTRGVNDPTVQVSPLAHRAVTEWVFGSSPNGGYLPPTAKAHIIDIPILRARIQNSINDINNSVADFITARDKLAQAAPQVRLQKLKITKPLDLDAVMEGREKAIIVRNALSKAKPNSPERVALQDLSDRVDDGGTAGDTGSSFYNRLRYSLGDDLKARQVLEAAGYDGATHVGGGIFRVAGAPTNRHRVWIAFHPEQVVGAFEEGGVIKRNVPKGTTPQPFEQIKQRLYEKFVNGWAGMLHESNKSLGNVIPEHDFNKLFDDFMINNGFDDSAKPGMYADFSRRLVKDIEKAIDPKESEVHRAVLGEFHRMNNELEGEFLRPIERLSKIAQTNRMNIEYESGGVIKVYGNENGKLLGKFNKVEDAQQFIRGTGQAKTVTYQLDDSGIPDNFGSQLPPVTNTPARGVFESIFDPKGTRRLKLIDVFNLNVPWLTPFPEWIKSVDNAHNTNLHGKFYDPSQVVFRKYQAAVTPWHNKIEAVQSILKGVKAGDRQLISSALETMTPQEVIDSYLGHRKLTLNEIKFGKDLADSKVDIARVFKFRREYLDMDKTKMDNTALEAEIGRLRTKWDMDDAHMKAFYMFQHIVSQPIEKLSLGAVTKYAESLQNDTMSRKDFMDYHNFSAKQKLALDRIEQIYKELADELEIPHNRRLGAYISHYRRYEALFNDDIPKTANEQFISELIRTNEIPMAELERDPVALMARYVNSAYRTKILYPELDEIRKTALGDLNLIENNAERTKIIQKLNNYMDGLHGYRNLDRKIASNHLQKYLEAIGLSKPSDLPVVHNAANNYLRRYAGLIELNAQGFRPTQGLRDFYGNVRNHYVRFGAERTKRMVQFLGDQEALEKFMESGQSPRLSSFEFATPGENAPSAFMGASKTAYQKIMDAGFTSSLQKFSYDYGHAAVYLETMDHTLKQMTKFAGKDYNWDKFAKDISLSSYDPGIQEHFKGLVQQSQYVDAAKFLARVTGQEHVFLYGASNHPIGWDSFAGKLGGQFGTWATYQTRFLARVASRGTLGERLTRIRRYAATETALAVADGYTGLNMTGWMSLFSPAQLFFLGGPIPQAVINGVQSMNSNEFIAARAQKDLENQANLLIPAGAALKGWHDAFTLWGRDFNPAYSAASAAGMRVDEQHTNWWDPIFTDGKETQHIPFKDKPVEYEVPSIGYRKGPEAPYQQDVGGSIRPKSKH